MFRPLASAVMNGRLISVDYTLESSDFSLFGSFFDAL